MKSKLPKSSNSPAAARQQPPSKTSNSSEPIFRGFVGGTAFITKKGHRGMSIDSLWVQNIFTAFCNDDDELAEIALKSSLADTSEVVEGGEFGTPFSIGEYGFYAQSQFDEQAQLLCDQERQNADKKYFLSVGEWDVIDRYLQKVAHYSNSVFESVRRGDTFGALAVKRNAFSVAIVLLRHGVDPLVENESGEDLFHSTQQQYLQLTVQMKDLSVTMDHSLYNPHMTRKQWEELDRIEAVLLTAFETMLGYLDELRTNLESRLVSIEADKKVKRRCELLNEAVTEFKLWNIDQEDKARKQITEIDSLKGFVTEKIFLYKQHQAKRSEQRVQNKHKNVHLLQLLAERSAQDALDAESASKEATDSEGESASEKGRSSRMSESRKIDRLIYSEARKLLGEDDGLSDGPGSGRHGVSPASSQKSAARYKPILGTLSTSHDTVISYR